MAIFNRQRRGLSNNSNTRYKKALNDYERTLSQRNSLLKKDNTNREDFFPWNVRLSHLGGNIVSGRTQLINEINRYLSDYYKQLSKKNENIQLKYLTTINLHKYESDLLKRLEENYQLDRMRGFTTSGPHRDDMTVLIDQKPAISVASRGEVRSVVVALKFIEALLIDKQSEARPIVLLDDVFSELDKDRVMLLSNFLNNYQAIITTTNATTTQGLKTRH